MTIRLRQTSCPLCKSKKNYTVLYPQNFSQRDFSTEVFSARRLPDRLHYQIVRCQNCGMVRSTPITEMETLSALYAKSTFTYEGEVHNLTKTYLSVLRPVLQKMRKKDLIVEVGCGSGFVLEAIREQGYSNVNGVEPSHDAIRKAPQTIRRKIKQSVFTRKLFPKRSVALLCIFQTLDHIPDPDKFLNECFEVLRPGGFLLSFHHNVESLSARVLRERSPIIDIEHTQLFSMKTSKDMFEQSGFHVTSLYSPETHLSLKHLCWLLPFPRMIKKYFLADGNPLAVLLEKYVVKLRLGNVCIVGEKPYGKT